MNFCLSLQHYRRSIFLDFSFLTGQAVNVAFVPIRRLSPVYR
jgi:hypothetical protein